jgi:antirestriction protein ArdC
MEQNDQKTRDVYAIATNKIIEHLEKGTVPWRKPWTDAGLPKNLISKKPYRGINVWLLAMCGYPHNLFLTFKQIKELGGSVKKGEKAHIVLFWKWIKKDKATDTDTSQHLGEATDKPKMKPLLRYYLVFNIDQCIGIPETSIPIVSRPNEPLIACEKVLDEMPLVPKIEHKEQRAYYHPEADIINMPRMDTFVSSEKYYATLFHELVHSTGHTSRLNRKELMTKDAFGSEQYSIEELTAEIGASYLSSHTGIIVDDFADNAAYISGWLDVLKKDKRFIIYASAQAQRAAEYILNQQQSESASQNQEKEYA